MRVLPFEIQSHWLVFDQGLDGVEGKLVFDGFFDEVMFWSVVESLFGFEKFGFLVVEDILILLVLFVIVVEVGLGSNGS